MRADNRSHGRESGKSLALRAREAAPALGISERHLWSLTNQGKIPHVRIGRSVIYPRDVLERWLAEQAAKGARR